MLKRNNLKEFNFKILNELHVFRAFIHEVLRISSVVPTGLPHMTNKEHMIEINGKKMVIPKNTICHSNTYYIQRFLDWNDNNKVLNEENNKIHLEYWINDEDGKFKMNDNFILFGIGKRNCVGQSVAMKAMYATFGIMINEYKFYFSSNNNKDIKFKQEFGVVLYIHPPIGINLKHRR